MAAPYTCFNLVIEVLLISSLTRPIGTSFLCILFQSRNRGSFDFKSRADMASARVGLGFNLVIEVLLISREKHVIVFDWLACSFNLVIEVLLISSEGVDADALPAGLFQSRNRGSFDFKPTVR